MEKGLPPLTCLNVNFPDMAELKGIKICEQAKGRWTNEWEPCPRKGDDNYFWLIGEFKDDEPENEKNDHWALANGYVAITPTVVDVTAPDFGRGSCYGSWYREERIFLALCHPVNHRWGIGKGQGF